MSTLSIDPKVSTTQLLEISEKLGTGFRHVAEGREINVNATPRNIVSQDGKTTLYRYGENPSSIETGKIPLLIIYALVNRPYMLDLEAGRSIVAGLVDNKVNTYLLDWGYPDISDQFLSLEDYLFEYLDSAVETILEKHGVDRLNLLGVCQGGVFSLCYAAARGEKVKNLITMVTPVEFHSHDNLLSRWIRALDVDAMVDTLGNVPGQLLNWTFLSLKPFVLGAQKYLDMIDSADDADRLETFLRMEKWIHDSPDQAGAAFAEFVRTFFIQNGFITDSVQIGGEHVSLQNITHPILNIIASRDHLVPPSASRPLETLTGSCDYTVYEEDAGHIGLFVGARSCKNVHSTITTWLQARS